MEDPMARKTSPADAFAGVPGQKALPTGDLDSSHAGTPSRHDSKRSAASGDSQDIDMDDDNTAGGSDNESTTGSSKPSKKKKGQRFYCTDYPPCSLSFTRSEHLARHIRKHTGERPFQCHCLRRFSRLDNLRQHAQTVHVNEDIPPESLAATGTRFQRQIRTDRVRSRGNSASISRPGAAVAAAAMSGRGHSRNVSTSSIGSVSDLGSPEDVRRRHQAPPPLAIAQATTPQSGLHVDTYGSHYSQQQENGPYYNMNQPSPNGYTTPTSVYSPENTAAGSRYSGLGSPIAMMPPGGHQHHHSHSHSHSYSHSHSHSHSQSGSGSSHARRLSQPSSSQPYYQAPYYSPPPSNGPYYVGASSSSSTAYPNNGSMFASPTTTTAFLPDSRQESSAEAEWRRRTWHPGSYSNSAPRPATSGLSYYQTPDAPQPVSADQPAAAQPQSSSNASAALRLPGIDSFDRGGAAAAPPPRRPLSTMEVDEPTRQAHEVTTRPLETETPSKRDSWGSVNQHFSQLDVKGTPSKHESTPSSWRHSAPVPAGGPQYHATPSFTFPPQSASAQPPSQEPPLTPSRTKRDVGFRAPARSSGDSVSTVRTSPEGSLSSDGLPTPSHHSTAEYHPAIVHSNGYVETHPPGSMVVDSPPKSHHRSRSAISSYSLETFPTSLDASRLPEPSRHHRHHSANTSRLDALVAVATNEERALQGH